MDLESHLPSSGQCYSPFCLVFCLQQLLKGNTVKVQLNAQVFISSSRLILLAFIW